MRASGRDPCESNRARRTSDDEQWRQRCFLAKRYRAARGRDDTEVPWEVAKRVVAGENAVKVYREWRGLTQEALARKVDSAKAYISKIETGAKPGGRAILRKIAGALGVPVSALSED